MAAPGEGGGKDEIKTHFATREGSYKLMHHSEYSKPSRVAFNGPANTPVKVSFVNVDDGSASSDRLCFNVGRELYVYVYKGVRKAADLTKPIDKRIYKGTLPTCHDFNQQFLSPDSVLLLVGFTAGQVQLIDPIKKEISKLYNEERLIDKTKVTCIKWIPGSPNQFLVSHSSGQMYVYNEELPCGQTPPNYQLFKQGDGFSVYTCKTKSTRNPLYRWMVGLGAINEFAFSPCARYLAVVSQDGHLRVFQYNTMELLGLMKSYFGGLLCVCWSPDGKYLVTGGEDDLVTVWSFLEKRVICRGQGHKSWVNMVAFDEYTSIISEDTSEDVTCSDGEVFVSPTEGSNHISSSSKTNSNANNPAQMNNTSALSQHHNGHHSLSSHRNSTSSVGDPATRLKCISYRFGSVGQDTELCLWDLTEDVMNQPYGKSRTSSSGLVSLNSSSSLPSSNSIPNSQKVNSNSAVNNELSLNATSLDGHAHPIQNAVMNASSKFNTLSVTDRKDTEKKEHKRNFSLAARNSDKTSVTKANSVRPVDSAMKLYGTQACPRMDQAHILEPLVCKKVSHERLTCIAFRNECIVTACQEGIVLTWARPGKGHEQTSALSPQPPTPAADDSCLTNC